MEIVENSIKVLEFDKVLDKLSSFAGLAQSRLLCKDLSPSKDVNQVNRLITLTKESKAILDRALDLPIEFVLNVDEIKIKLNSYLNEEELVNVAKTLKASRQVRNFIKENSEDDGLLNELAVNLFADKVLEDRIFDLFDGSLNIKKDATIELKSLFNSLQDTEINLKTRVSDLLNNPEFAKHLQEQIYTTRDDRIVFQVRASSKSKVEGIIHDVSASNQSFYIEPKQIVHLNNKLRELEIKIHAEIIRILTELTKLIKENIDLIEASEAILSEIDLHFAKARYAIKLRATEPKVCAEKYMKIVSMRHPLLGDYVENVVENDFEIGHGYKSVIITGSNTGGKTVAIKTLGLFILMLKTGLFLPCYEAEIYPFENVLADIGDEQNIAQSLSTFSSHMTNIINILGKSDDKTFVVIDEICAGTDPIEGSVLAEVILEKLAQKNVLSCVTTHYGELKSLEFSNNYFKNASVEFDLASLKPTYKLIIGLPGLSNAISISATLGLDMELVEKAKNIVVSQKDPSIVVVEKLQETQLQLSQKLDEAERINADASILKTDYDKKLSELKKEKKQAIKNIKAAFSGELEDTKSEIKDILNEMRKEKSEKIARRSYARLAKLEKNFLGKTDKYSEKEIYQELNWSEVKVGDKVLLKELHKSVEIISLPDKNDNVLVQLGLIRTKVKKDKLAVVDEKLTQKPMLRFSKQESFTLQKQELSNKLDLRGYRVEEALDSLEFFLDKASLINLTPVYIIHGHGTGALKSAIKDFVLTSPYVAKYRFGENAEGGEGVTVIDVN